MKPVKPIGQRKPIPRKRDHWEREVAGIRKFLSDLKGVDPNALGGWGRKQTAYYQARLKTLLEHRPRGVKAA